jgi:hypothetical protein
MSELERITARRSELDALAEELGKRLREVEAEWEELVIAGRVLPVLRCDQRPGDLAGGNGVHRTTVTRWVREVVGLLAARAPRLDRALKKIARKGGGVVLLDGHADPHPAAHRNSAPEELLRQAPMPWPARDRAHRRPGPAGMGLRGPARADLGDHRLPSRQAHAEVAGGRARRDRRPGKCSSESCAGSWSKRTDTPTDEAPAPGRNGASSVRVCCGKLNQPPLAPRTNASHRRRCI